MNDPDEGDHMCYYHVSDDHSPFICKEHPELRLNSFGDAVKHRINHHSEEKIKVTSKLLDCKSGKIKLKSKLFDTIPQSIAQ